MRTYKVNRVFYSVGVILLGLILLLKPDASLTLVSQCIGLVMTAGGALTIFSFIKNNRSILSGATALFAFILIIVGLWILTKPQRLASLIPSVIGIVIIFSGLLNVGEAFFAGGRKGSSMIMGIITIILGWVIVSQAFGIASLLTRVGGGALIYDGVTDLLIARSLGETADRPRSDGPIDTSYVEVEKDTEEQ